MTTQAPAAPIVTEQRVKAPLTRLLRAELRFMIRRPRTLVAFVVLVAAPIIAGFALATASGPPPSDSGDQALAGVAALIADNGMILPVFSLMLAMVMLLPMLGAMWSADALAAEAQTGGLRGLLLAPVGRVRLLGVKAFGVAVLTFLAVATVAVVGTVAGLLILGGDGMVTMSGNTLSFVDSLARVGLLVVLVTIQVWAVAAVALAISATTDHPLVVLASALGGIIVFSILSNIAALDWLHPVLITDGWRHLADVVRDPIPSGNLMEGVLRAGCYIAIGYSLALARISTKDG